MTAREHLKVRAVRSEQGEGTGVFAFFQAFLSVSLFEFAIALPKEAMRSSAWPVTSPRA